MENLPYICRIIIKHMSTENQIAEFVYRMITACNNWNTEVLGNQFSTLNFQCILHSVLFGMSLDRQFNMDVIEEYWNGNSEDVILILKGKL